MVIPHFRFDSSISAGGQLSRKDIDRLAREGFRSILNLSEEGEPGQLLSPNVEATWAHANTMEHCRVSVSVDHLHSHWVDRFLEALDELPRPSTCTRRRVVAQLHSSPSRWPWTGTYPQTRPSEKLGLWAWSATWRP